MDIVLSARESGDSVCRILLWIWHYLPGRVVPDYSHVLWVWHYLPGRVVTAYVAYYCGYGIICQGEWCQRMYRIIVGMALSARESGASLCSILLWV